MTAVPASSLSQAKVRQLLAAVGTAPAPGQAPVQATDYDWRDPHYFSEDQLDRLALTLGQAAGRMAEIFGRFYNSEFEGAMTSVSQHFADELRRPMEDEHRYCLTFGPDKGPSCGFLMVSAGTALALVRGLLSDSGAAEDPGRPLSPLEESLLADLLTAVLEAFLAPLRPHHNLKTGHQLCRGEPSIQFELTEEICRTVFRAVKKAGEDAFEVDILTPCSKLAAGAGKSVPAAPRISPQELSHMLMEHLQQTSVTVTARLASTAVSFREALELGPGDVLLLGKPLDGPVEVIIDGRTAFRGRPTRSHGHYAILITDAMANRTQETAGPKATK